MYTYTYIHTQYIHTYTYSHIHTYIQPSIYLTYYYLLQAIHAQYLISFRDALNVYLLLILL